MTGGGPCPVWLRAANYVEAFGAQAVFGRVLRVREMDCMIMAMNLRTAYYSQERYRDKNGAQNWAEWAQHNPELSAILTAAMVESERNGE